MPGKPLLDLAGRPLVAWVWEIARDSGAGEVWVATDDERIRDAAVTFGAQVCMTSPDHTTGTDRIHEVAVTREWSDDTIVVNLQGDEPMVPPEMVSTVVGALIGDSGAGLATVATPVTSLQDALNPNIVKVVCDVAGRALYFSRAPIPFHRDGAEGSIATQRLHDGLLRHIGLYAYRVGALRALATLPVSPIESVEKLEQLRALWNGMPIAISVVEQAPPAGIDTPDDLARIRGMLGA